MAAPRVVLDTNVVLDWLLFDDPAGRRIGQAVDAGHLEWVATAAMLDELTHVLARAPWARWSAARETAPARAAAACHVLPAPAATAAPGATCRDPDDQKFFDLACALPAAWLLTRDRALLDMRRAAAARGVTVLTPARWLAREG